MSYNWRHCWSFMGGGMGWERGIMGEEQKNNKNVSCFLAVLTNVLAQIRHTISDIDDRLGVSSYSLINRPLVVLYLL